MHIFAKIINYCSRFEKADAFYSSFCFKYVFVFNLKEVNCRLFISL